VTEGQGRFLEQYVLDARIVETLEEHAFAHHAGGTEDCDVHE
jgi:hypothetical protein